MTTSRKILKIEIEDSLLLLCASLPFLVLFFRIRNDGFWVDEAISRIISSGGVSNLFEWCYSSFSQSPFYYLIPLSLNWLGLNDALSMRVPSLLCLLGVLFFQLKICEELGHKKMFLPASAILFFLPGVHDGLLLARPYALALLCLQIARWRLIRYRRYFKSSDLVLGGLTSAAAFYCHYLFIDGLLIDWILTLLIPRFWEVKNIPIIVLLILVSLPGLAHVVHINSFASGLNYIGSFQWEMVDDAFTFPIPYLIPIASLFAIITIAVTYKKAALNNANQVILLGCLGSVFPYIIKAVFSVWFGLTIYVGRYLLSAGPSLALLFGYAICCLIAGFSRQVLSFLMLALAAVIAFRDLYIHHPDLSVVLRPEVRGDSSQTVLLHGGLAEANIESWNDDYQRNRYLSSALRVYDENRKVINLPASVQAGEGLIQKRVRMLAGIDRALLIFIRFDQGIFDSVQTELERAGYLRPQKLLLNSEQVWLITRKPELGTKLPL